MAMILYGRNKTRYELGDKQLKKGGEGYVYPIIGRPNSVAKIYHPERVADPQIRETTKDKILAMIDMHFDPHFNGKILVAWPEDALFDSSGCFLGFVMQKIEGMKSVLWAMRPTDRDVLWPNGYRWHYSIAMAFNLALTIERLHAAGIVVGDMNTNNILIDASGNVTLIDADSFNISTQNGKVYKCIVGVDYALPPELQGKDLSKPTSHFNEKTDCFALAIHIFTLLCNNCHPFGCLDHNTAQGSSSTSSTNANIARGYCPYVSGSTAPTVPDALDMGVFPQELRDLFDRTFKYDATTAVKPATIANRPSAQEWRIALSNLYNSGVETCKKNMLHEFPRDYNKGCPWCAMKHSPVQPSQGGNGGNPPINPYKHVSIAVKHCDKDGNVLRSQVFDVAYGTTLTINASSIPGYHLAGSNTKVNVSVDNSGKASESQVRFIYEKDKVKSSGGKKFFKLFLILAVIYCLIMFGLSRSAISEGSYALAKRYMDWIPFYKVVFSDDYNSNVKEIYDYAVMSYRNGDYSSAFVLFSELDESYGKTKVYLDFCRTHTGKSASYYTTIIQNLDFEDAKTLLTMNAKLFCRYMQGTWTTYTSEGKETVSMKKNGGGNYTSSNMPEITGGRFDSFDIENGVWQYKYEDSDTWVDYYWITIYSEDYFTLFAIDSGKTYNFSRD